MNGPRPPRKDLPPVGTEILVRFVVYEHERHLGMVLVGARDAGAPVGRFYLYPHEYELAPPTAAKERP